jgi:hypothetical protein
MQDRKQDRGPDLVYHKPASNLCKRFSKAEQEAELARAKRSQVPRETFLTLWNGWCPGFISARADDGSCCKVGRTTLGSYHERRSKRLRWPTLNFSGVRTSAAMSWRASEPGKQLMRRVGRSSETIAVMSVRLGARGRHLDKFFLQDGNQRSGLRSHLRGIIFLSGFH